ncbi:hypothetical protein E2562_035719 [Oryza meyeriana var. granulata]|uniref:Uncharacterized protein n=1 Tax=Oryza meyeriana var. granulata TaxID=110450 RepID=A0A6G1E7X3_9ORYZ|nr:hypothetical protein E2562_035719 [Oryza meyeriana var. granulata]
MTHCRLLQWRFANAKAEAVSKNRLSILEVEFMGAWARISELQGLESWGQLESKHAVALASTIGCTQAAVCKLPLTNGAKGEISLPSVAIILQQALDLTMTSKTTVRPFTPMAHDTTLLIAELVDVVREEHASLQEGLELLGRVSALQAMLMLILIDRIRCE